MTMTNREFGNFLISAIIIAFGLLYIYIGKQMLSTELPKVFDWLVIIDGAVTTLVGMILGMVRLGDICCIED